MVHTWDLLYYLRLLSSAPEDFSEKRNDCWRQRDTHVCTVVDLPH